jgi:8-oxo-dGTP pyrophosphatase MutT (NUDIX family)
MTENILFDKKSLACKDKSVCVNCGNIGHDYKHCKEPVTSWGIILIQMEDKSSENTKKNIDTDLKQYNNHDGILLNNKNDLVEACKYMNLIRFLLVRRKHSLGYIEFIRGRYIKDNIDGIIYLFQQMTPDEINKIDTMDFNELWNDFWGSDSKKLLFNKKEFTESKEKFDSLKNKTGVELSLGFYIKNVKPFYSLPEWGFPKGRKLRGESDLDCAIREFTEETCLETTDIKIITSVKPIIENIIGTNGISYRHIYYLAENLSDKIPIITEKNNTEIGDIGFFTYEDANYMLRDYHIEKKNILKNVFIYYLDLFINNINKKVDDNVNYWSTEVDNF